MVITYEFDTNLEILNKHYQEYPCNNIQVLLFILKLVSNDLTNSTEKSYLKSVKKAAGSTSGISISESFSAKPP